MKILGMGNALVDIMTRLEDDSILQKFKFAKGSMTLINKEMSSFLDTESGNLERQKSSGGSAANTIHGLAHLGVETSFLGKIGSDYLGNFFKNDMQEYRINPILFNSTTETGRVVAFISPDSERTMATYLGAAVELDVQDITKDLYKGHDFLYVEGYLVQNRDLIEKAFQLAKQEGLKTCIDLASFNIVLENVVFLRKLIKEYVDIVFANEEEAKALTGKAPEEALDDLSGLCEIAVVKIGERGSLIKTGKEIYNIQARKSDSIDTTGAGDLYAAGFLFGLSKGYSLKLSGGIGSILAGNVIEVIGAKMDDSIWERVWTEIRILEKA